MINQERERALTEIEEEKETEEELSEQGVASALLQVFFGNQNSNRRQGTTLREVPELREDPNPEVQNFIRCFYQHEEYYHIPSRFY